MEPSKKMVQIYTDGACSGNPGAGGWAAILLYKEHEKIISGCEKSTTNNRMELMAVIKGLEALKESCTVTIYSDSAYVVNAIMGGWLTFWRTHNWRTKSNASVKNQDLWERLLIEMNKHLVAFTKVEGHSDNEYNNKCDQIARNEILNIK